MRLARHAHISVPSLLVCMLLSGNILVIINPPAILLTLLMACLALVLPQHRQKIETSWLVGLPLYCAIGVVTVSTMQDLGKYVALGLCGSVYGLTWFGLNPESQDPNWRRWTTAVPVLALAGLCLATQAGSSTELFHAPGLGVRWILHASLAAAIVVVVAVWRRPANPTAIWSFGAAATLCLAAKIFQNLEQTNALDIALVFLPYAAGVLATLASRSARLFHNAPAAEPVGEQLRPLG